MEYYFLLVYIDICYFVFRSEERCSLWLQWEKKSLRPASAASYLELKVSLCPVASKTRCTHTLRHACIRLVSLEMPGGWRGSLSIQSQTPARLSSPICPLSLYHLHPANQSSRTHACTHTEHLNKPYTLDITYTLLIHTNTFHTPKYNTNLFCRAQHRQHAFTQTHPAKKTM